MRFRTALSNTVCRPRYLLFVVCILAGVILRCTGGYFVSRNGSYLIVVGLFGLLATFALTRFYRTESSGGDGGWRRTIADLKKARSEGAISQDEFENQVIGSLGDDRP